MPLTPLTAICTAPRLLTTSDGPVASQPLRVFAGARVWLKVGRIPAGSVKIVVNAGWFAVSETTPRSST